jgi:hypothetical protein
MKPISALAILIATTIAISFNAHAAGLASDSAADAAYNDGWQTGDNGGTGFGAWSLTSIGPSGFFTQTSTGNGFGADPGNDGDINSAGRAWGTYASLDGPNSGVALATRAFTGALDEGQTFVIDMDNGFIQNSSNPAGTVGFSLQNSAGREKFWFQFTGGDSTYKIIDGTGAVDTGIAFTDQGLHIEFTMGSVDISSTYSVRVTAVGSDGPSGLPFVHSGTLFDSALDPVEFVDRVQLFNYTAGNGSSADAFFNNMAVVPEPATGLLVGLGLLGVAALRKRR